MTNHLKQRSADSLTAKSFVKSKRKPRSLKSLFSFEVIAINVQHLFRVLVKK